MSTAGGDVAAPGILFDRASLIRLRGGDGKWLTKTPTELGLTEASWRDGGPDF